MMHWRHRLLLERLMARSRGHTMSDSTGIAALRRSRRPLRLRRLRRRYWIERIGVSAFAVIGALAVAMPVGWAAAHLVERIIR